MKQISDPGGGLPRPRTWNIGSHEDFQKRYVRLTSAVIRKISENKPQNCKKNRRRKKNHFIQKNSKKVPFFAQDCYIQKVSYWRELICYNFVKMNEHPWKFVTPLGKSNLGLWPWHKSADTELEIFRVAFFSDAWIAAVGWPFCQFSPRPLFSHCFHEIFILRTSAFLYCGFFYCNMQNSQSVTYTIHSKFTLLCQPFSSVFWPLFGLYCLVSIS